MYFRKILRFRLTGKLLALFLLINIIGDIGNVVFWWVNPESRALSLNTGYIAVNAGADSALIAGTVILLMVAALYAVALVGFLQKYAWMPLLVISVSIVNRIIALLLYEFSIAFLFWTAWTAILVVLSFLVWRRWDKPLRLWSFDVSSPTNS